MGPVNVTTSFARKSLAFLRRRWRRVALFCSLFFAFFFAFALAVLCWPMDTAPYLATAPSCEILDRSGQPLYTFLNARQEWSFTQPLGAMSPRLVQATLAAEDRRFWSHPGVDPFAVVRAAWQMLRQRRVHSGASTLTMQVVKLAGHPSRSLPGKLVQMTEALRLELRVDKNRIMEAYLNHAPYGRNLVGAEAAARRYFGKSARGLTLPEAALLAALPKAPGLLEPLGRGAGGALKRRNFVLARMHDEGFISEDERRRAAEAPLGAAWHPFPALAPLLAHRLAPLLRAQPRLVTTLDRPTQIMAEQLLREHLKKYGGEIRNAALIVADPETAAVRAWVGTADFWSAAPGSQFDAARARRSPGSTLKPFIYALALERNRLYPSEVLLDSSLDLGTYNPRNFDKQYHGLIAADAALRRSLNIPAVMVLRRVGQPAVYDFLRQAGLATLNRPAAAYGLGLALGNCEIRLDQLCAAYTMLAGQGQYRPLTVLPGPGQQPGRLLSRATARELCEMLEQPLPGELDAAALGTVGTAARVCWKTGTSTGNHDAWAFVFNAQAVVGVWMGNPDGRSSRRLVGAEAALPLAGQLFRRLPPRHDPAPPDPGDDFQAVEVCATSGLPRSTWCEHVRTVRLPRGQDLGRICDVHWPASGAAPEGQPSRVVEHWPGSSRSWDLASITAPVIPGQPRATGVAGTLHALQILNPPANARFILTGEPNGDRIGLRSSVDQQGAVHWYLDGRFLATAEPQQPVLLDLTAGRHKLVCMTPQGTTAQIHFQVLAPTESNPDFARATEKISPAP